MATVKSYTDIEQSRKLAEILPLESADMRYGYTAPYEYSDRMYDGGYDEIPYPKDFLVKNPNYSADEYDAELPCWSLVALLGVLPDHFYDKTGRKELGINKSDTYYYVFYENKNSYIEKRADNPIDACYEMILKLHELKML